MHSSIRMLIPGLIIGLTVLASIAAVKGYEFWRVSTTNNFEKIAFCIISVGMVGFCEPLWLGFLPHVPRDNFELPNSILKADRLTTPDGRVFIVSRPILRVQRYGPEGFEKGFFAGKASSSAISASGNILICSPGGALFTYTPDGELVPPQRACPAGLGHSLFDPSRAKVPAIAFNWFSALAVPLWHPLAGWLIFAFGNLLLNSSLSSKWR